MERGLLWWTRAYEKPQNVDKIITIMKMGKLINLFHLKDHQQASSKNTTYETHKNIIFWMVLFAQLWNLLLCLNHSFGWLLSFVHSFIKGQGPTVAMALKCKWSVEFWAAKAELKCWIKRKSKINSDFRRQWVNHLRVNSTFTKTLLFASLKMKNVWICALLILCLVIEMVYFFCFWCPIELYSYVEYWA